MSERKYTLDEAALELGRRQCAATGHVWDILTRFDGTPRRLLCSRCGSSGAVIMDSEAD